MGQALRDNQWGQYRREGDPHLNGRDKRDKPHHANGTPKEPPVDWQAKAKTLAKKLTPESRRQLAEVLGLPETALACLPLIGFGQNEHGGFWSFPEVDGSGRIIGILRRPCGTGSKMAMQGSKRGLIVPTGWDAVRPPSPLFVVEGPSDVLALAAMGLPAVGRPNNTCGAEQIAELVGGIPEGERPRLAVVGEWDARHDGTWPGLEGAKKVAGELKAALGDGWVVAWVLPPIGHKDARAWLNARQLDPACADEWSEAGEEWLKALEDKDQYVDEAKAVRIRVIDSPTFAAAEYPLAWHVRKVLVKGQPAVIGGPKKCLKTSILCDLAISIGSGTSFLGHFDSEGPTPIGFLSGESGPHTIQDTARNVCHARGIVLANAGVWWGFAVPQLSQAEHLEALAKAIQENGLEAIIIDPLYLCLLAGNKDAQAGNLFDMGPLLAEVSRVCLDAGATPLLCHHNIKRPPDPFGIPELEDLAFAGIQEFARQWVLVGRREKYDVGSGLHKLWLSIGGSAGFSSSWALDVDEGILDDEFQGKRWVATVAPATEAIAEQKAHRAEERQQRQADKDRDDDVAVLHVIDGLSVCGGPAPTFTQVRRFVGMGGDRFGRATERLIAKELIEEIGTTYRGGRGADLPAKGLRRKPPTDQRSERSGPSMFGGGP